MDRLNHVNIKQGKDDEQKEVSINDAQQQQKNYECNDVLYSKRFCESGDLTKHQLIHKNVESFRCHLCDKQFTLKHHLESHLLIHSGERPFTCRHCEKSFTQLGNRNKHEQAIHLQVKPYRCKQCGHTATQLANIITHIRSVHFVLPKTIKQQQALNITDNRDPRELVDKV